MDVDAAATARTASIFRQKPAEGIHKFRKEGGQQINLHIMDLGKLHDAIDHPEKPEYRNLVVRVTGYCARFITLSRDYQEDFIARVNHANMN